MILNVQAILENHDSSRSLELQKSESMENMISHRDYNQTVVSSCSSRGVDRKKKNVHPFIVASVNAQCFVLIY